MKQLQKTIMQCNVTIAICECISNILTVTYKNISFYKKSLFARYCIKCFEDIIPFSAILNKNFYETNLGKKEKIKVLTKKVLPRNDDFIDDLNNAMDDFESNMVCSKYCEPHEMAPLLKNSNKDLSFHSFSHWGIFNTQ